MWVHYTTLLNSVGHKEWLWALSIILNSGKDAITELHDQSNETVTAAKFGHDLPQPIMAYSLKGLGQDHKGNVQANILFLTLLLLPCNEYHVNSSTGLSIATLTVWQQILLEVLSQMVQQDPGQDFLCDGK